jgi:broad specificity phosphatase PhoE
VWFGVAGEFLRRHSSKWRLTDLGRQQAEAAGKWLRENFPGKSFDRFYVSEYIRCMETAARLDIPHAR